jgi:drug/metabolite transporter (DMT)-like permease
MAAALSARPARAPAPPLVIRGAPASCRGRIFACVDGPRERSNAQRTPLPITTKSQPHVGPYLLLGGAQLAVGAAAIFARFALTGAAPLAVAASRLCIAAFVLLLIAAGRGGRRTTTRVTRAQAVALSLAGIALGAHFAGWIASLDYTTIAISTLLVASTPIWTALYDAIARRRPPSRLALVAFVAGGIGLAMVVAFNRTPPPVTGHALLGAALALSGSAAMAVYLLFVREVRNALDTRTIVTHTYSWAAVVLAAAAAVAHQPPPRLADAAAWGGILAMAFISQLLGHTAINASLRWFSPSAVSFTTLIEPVSAAILAFIVFGEALSPAAIGGGVILLASVAVVLREDRAGATAQAAI